MYCQKLIGLYFPLARWWWGDTVLTLVVLRASDSAGQGSLLAVWEGFGVLRFKAGWLLARQALYCTAALWA